MVTLLLRTLENERYLLVLPYIFSAHLAHKARKTKPKLSHAIKSHIQKIAWFRHLSLSIQAQKKKKQQLRTSRSGVRVPPSAPEKALRIAVLFLFYTAIETLSFSHFSTAHNPPLFCKSKTTPVFFDHRQKSHPRAPAVVSFLILTQKFYHNFVFQNLSIIW